MKTNYQSLRYPWDTMKSINIFIVRVPEGEKREKGAEHFTNLMKDMNINIQGAQQTASKMNSKRPTLRHIMMKFLES